MLLESEVKLTEMKSKVMHKKMNFDVYYEKPAGYFPDDIKANLPKFYQSNQKLQTKLEFFYAPYSNAPMTLKKTNKRKL